MSEVEQGRLAARALPAERRDQGALRGVQEVTIDPNGPAAREEAVEFGVTMFPTDYSIGPADLARAIEERGFDAFFFPEHTHIPASRKSPFRVAAEMPPEYSHTLDPFVAMSAAAAVTSACASAPASASSSSATRSCSAKEVASLDHLSGGRFAVRRRRRLEPRGDGEPRHRARARSTLLRERIEAMKAIWTQDEAELPRASSSTSTRSGPGPSRCSSRTRRSSSAAMPSARWTG